MKTPEIYIPAFRCPDNERPFYAEQYRLAQERMWGLNARRDTLQRLLDATDKELASVFSEARELLMEFPTLSLKARK